MKVIQCAAIHEVRGESGSTKECNNSYAKLTLNDAQDSSCKVLGIQWNQVEYALQFEFSKIPSGMHGKKITTREILSFLANTLTL